MVTTKRSAERAAVAKFISAGDKLSGMAREAAARLWPAMPYELARQRVICILEVGRDLGPAEALRRLSHVA